MLNKTLFALLAMLAISLPAYSIELPDGATPNFDESSTGYASAYQFNKILEAYGLKLSPEAVSGVPTSYASVANGEVAFNEDSVAYTPAQYHTILTAYGLELKPEAVSEKLGGVSSYATVENGEIMFGNDSVAYGGTEWTTILSAYSLPMVAAVPPPPPAPAPAPAPKMAMPMDSDHDGVTDDKDACPGTPMGAAVNERGCWALSSALLFDLNKATIKKEFYPMLDATKKVFDDNPEMKVQIEGHCDNTGTEQYNQMLSEKRANAVMNYLVNNLGISASRLTAVGYGEMHPGFTNANKEGRAKNRRVVFTPMM